MDRTLTKGIDALIKRVHPSYRKPLKHIYLGIAQDILWMMHGGEEPERDAPTPSATPSDILSKINSLESAIKSHHASLIEGADAQGLAQSAVSLQGTLVQLRDMINRLQPPREQQSAQPFSNNQLQKIEQSINRLQLSIDEIQSKLVLSLRTQGAI